MRVGDMVRFRDVLNHRTEELSEWKYGVIVAEYHTWEKVATVLHEGELRRIRAQHIEIHQRGHSNNDR